MKRVVKTENSPILANGWHYGIKSQRPNIAEQLLMEQQNLCAYTETYLAGRTDAMEIDHFNPTLKGEDGDDYQNWVLIKAQWNREKSDKWVKYQPILHPTDETFEKRIFYIDGYYLVDKEDIEAKNLRDLLKLNDPNLVEERVNYIERTRNDIEDSGKTAEEFFNDLYSKWPDRVYFRTAILAEFNTNPFQ